MVLSMIAPVMAATAAVVIQPTSYDVRGIALGSSLEAFQAAKPGVTCSSDALGRTTCSEMNEATGFAGANVFSYYFTPTGFLYKIDLLIDRSNISAVTDSLTSRWGSPARRSGTTFHWSRNGQTIRYETLCVRGTMCVAYEDTRRAAEMRELERQRNRNAL